MQYYFWTFFSKRCLEDISPFFGPLVWTISVFWLHQSYLRWIPSLACFITYMQWIPQIGWAQIQDWACRCFKPCDKTDPLLNELCRLGYYYRPQRSWSKVIFSQASVILFTGGVCLSACWDTIPHQAPPDQAPPRTRHPPPHLGPVPPPGTRQAPILGDTVNERAVCILLECNLISYLVFWKYTKLPCKIHSMSVLAQMLDVNAISIFKSSVH